MSMDIREIPLKCGFVTIVDADNYGGDKSTDAEQIIAEAILMQGITDEQMDRYCAADQRIHDEYEKDYDDNPAGYLKSRDIYFRAMQEKRDIIDEVNLNE
jgi:hypothetical protein